MKSTSFKLSLAKNYPSLLKQVTNELGRLEVLVKRSTVESYWKVGKFIHTHLLANKDRADYGNFLFENLQRDTGKSSSILRRAVKFYATYPIVAARPQLSWTQYKQLITVKDRGQRKELEAQFVQKDFDSRRSQAFLNFKKQQLAAQESPERPIPQLKFCRGKLFTYSVVDAGKVLTPKNMVTLDLGFDLWRQVEKEEAKDIKITDKPEYTYSARVEKVIDADTLWVQVDCGFSTLTRQKLRLRGIDCPEVDTDEGKAAQSFTRKCLGTPAKGGQGSLIVIRTHKDDKYGRYLADVFYLGGETDSEKISQEGVFLNQELLNQRLAVLM